MHFSFPTSRIYCLLAIVQGFKNTMEFCFHSCLLATCHFFKSTPFHHPALQLPSPPIIRHTHQLLLSRLHVFHMHSFHHSALSLPSPPCVCVTSIFHHNCAGLVPLPTTPPAPLILLCRFHIVAGLDLFSVVDLIWIINTSHRFKT